MPKKKTPKKYEVAYEEDPIGSAEIRRDLVIRHNGEEIARHWDCGEPEDNSFYRDWKWVKEELERAYELGLSENREAAEILEMMYQELKDNEDGTQFTIYTDSDEIARLRQWGERRKGR